MLQRATGLYRHSKKSIDVLGYGTTGGANGRVAVKGGSRGLDAFEAAVLALNLPASSAGVNYQFTQGNYICVPNLYSSSGAHASCLCAPPLCW